MREIYAQQVTTNKKEAQNQANQGKLRVAQNPQETIIPIKAGFTQFEVINAIYDSKILSSVKLTAGARLVLISLARHYNPSNDEFFPSYACIASHTGVSKKSVERAIKELVGAGLITYRTEKVNRYRFTGRFFASVNLSVPQRQNDGSLQRQNDEQTNNNEKINNNKNILNFSLKCKDANNLKTPINSSLHGYEKKEIIEDSQGNLSDEKFSAPAGQNVADSAPNPCNETAGAISFTSNFSVQMSSERNKTQNPYYQHFSSSSYAKNRSSCAYSVPLSAQKGGTSFTPSVSSTDEYLKSVRKARQEACSPLEFDYDNAKRWYNSLSVPLRKTALACKVAKKFQLD